MLTALHTRARKKDAPPLVDAEGQPLAVAPQAFSWCRLAFSVTMVQPKTGQVFSLEQGPRTRRVVMYAPKGVVLTLTAALVSSTPWLRDLANWLITHWK